MNRPLLPPASHEARRLGSRPMRWRGSSPVLAAVVRELNAARSKATTPTEPAPAPEVKP